MSHFTLAYRAYAAPPLDGPSTATSRAPSLRRVGDFKARAAGDPFVLFEDTFSNTSPLTWAWGLNIDAINILHKELCELILDSDADVSAAGLFEFSCRCQDLYGPLGVPSLSLSPSHQLLVEVHIISIDYNFDKQKIQKPFEIALMEAETIKESGNALITGKEPKFEEARKAYLKSVELLDPFTIAPKSNSDGGMDREVLSDAEKATLREKLNVYRLNLAHCELELQRPGIALALCSRVLESDPQNAKAHYRTGLVYERCQLLSAAKWHFHQSNAIAPTALSKKKVEALKELEEKEREAKRKKLFEGMFSGGDYSQRRKKF